MDQTTLVPQRRRQILRLSMAPDARPTKLVLRCLPHRRGALCPDPSPGTTSTTTTTLPVALTTALVGFVPSIDVASDVVPSADGRIAWVAETRFGLVAVDVHAPGAPLILGASNPPFDGERIAVGTSSALLSMSAALGLAVVDLSAPATPRTVGALGGTFTGVAIAEPYGYAVETIQGNPAHTDLVVIDLHAPSAPVIVGRVTAPGSGIAAMQLVGSTIYAASGTSGLQIFDVATPTAPHLVGSLVTVGPASAVAVAGGLVYLAAGSVFQIIDVSTRAAPAPVGSLATTLASAVAIGGSRAYVLDAGQLTIIDVSTPGSPHALSTTSGHDATRLAVSGTLVELASRGDGLYLIDASTPTHPTQLSNVHGTFDVATVSAAGTLALVGATGVRVVDVSTPSAPVVVGSLPGTVRGSAMAGNFAYLNVTVPGNPAHDEFDVVSLETPAQPAVVGQLTPPALGDIEIVGSTVYATARTAGFIAIDVGAPSHPTLLSHLDLGGSSTSALAVAGARAYVTADTALDIIDVTVPTAPAPIGAFPTTGATAVAIDDTGTTAFVVDGAEVKSIDVRTPGAAALLGTSPSFGAQGIAVVGQRMFLATPAAEHTSPTGGVHVVDITDPTHPAPIARLVVPGSVRALARSGPGVPHLLYVGDGAATVDVIDPLR